MFIMLKNREGGVASLAGMILGYCLPSACQQIWGTVCVALVVVVMAYTVLPGPLTPLSFSHSALQLPWREAYPVWFCSSVK